MQFNDGVYNSDIWRQKFRDCPYLKPDASAGSVSRKRQPEASIGSASNRKRHCPFGYYYYYNTLDCVSDVTMGALEDTGSLAKMYVHAPLDCAS